MIQFWWSSGSNRKKIPWVAWKKLCLSKENGGLGFHDISKFNQALLCKQAWKIIDNPNSLLSTILKSKYFPSSSFMESGVGSRPSYAWRSIIFGRALLSKGLIKQIGNGLSTRVWSENWILDDIPRPPIARDIIDPNLLVSDLLLPDLSGWDSPRIHQVFIQEDARRILSLKISPDLPDSYVWSFSNNGIYSSQSGYKLLESLPDIDQLVPDPLPPLEKALWSKIWKVKAPPKIRHFLWKILAGALAVADRLRSRGINLNPTCQVCQEKEETICHLLFLFPLAQRVWGHSGFPLPLAGFFSSSAFLNMHHLLSCCSKSSTPATAAKTFPWILWHLWKARNSLIFDQKQPDPFLILAQAQEDSEVWFNASVSSLPKLTHHTSSIPPCSWQPPPPNVLKCNIGSSWSSSNWNSGSAWLIRDNAGVSKLHSRRGFSFVKSSLEADLLSILWAVESSFDLHLHGLIFESSSPQAVKALIHPHLFPRFRNLIFDIQRILRLLESEAICFVPYSGNLAASKIASSVTTEHRFQSYVSRGGPGWLANVIEQEAPRH